MKTLSLGFVAALALLGCGGAAGSEEGSAGDETAGGEGRHGEGHHGEGRHGEGHHGEGHHGEGEGHHGEGAGGHEDSLPEQLRAFHDVLSPVYHLEPGAERAAASCAAQPELAELSTRLNADAEEAAGQLGATCAAGELDDAGVTAAEAALEAMHGAFHREVLAAQE